LVDTGADTNVIKINVLNKNVPITNEKMFLKGIGDIPVETLGYVKVPIDDCRKEIKFYIVHESFPIPRDGIVGKPFLKDNDLSINVKKQILFDDNHMDPAVSQSIKQNLDSLKPKNSFIIPPRCEKI